MLGIPLAIVVAATPLLPAYFSDGKCASTGPTSYSCVGGARTGSRYSVECKVRNGNSIHECEGVFDDPKQRRFGIYAVYVQDAPDVVVVYRKILDHVNREFSVRTPLEKTVFIGGVEGPTVALTEEQAGAVHARLALKGPSKELTDQLVEYAERRLREYEERQKSKAK